MMARKRLKFHEHGAHNDIRYSGPLSYQSFQILGWTCIVLTVVVYLMVAAIKVNPEEAQRFASAAEIIGYIAMLSLPFLLMANFAKILNNSEGYKKQLLRNGGAMAAIAITFILVFNRYVVGTVGLLLQDPNDAYPLVMTTLYEVNTKGFIAFNIFVDLLLCTLVMYCLNARPKKVFTGKKLIILRFLAVIPIGYELASLLLKYYSALGQIRIPSWAFPLLTVKPPMTFLVFVLMAIYIKTRELRYCRHGKTHEDYQAFLKTNRNALQFSLFSALVLFVAGVVDMILLVVFLKDQAGSLEDVEKLVSSTQELARSAAVAMGFGSASLPLLVISPIVLLFNYTKIPKNKNVSMLIPIAGIALILMILVQGIYQLIAIAPIEKVDGKEIQEVLTLVFGLMKGG